MGTVAISRLEDYFFFHLQIRQKKDALRDCKDTDGKEPHRGEEPSSGTPSLGGWLVQGAARGGQPSRALSDTCPRERPPPACPSTFMRLRDASPGPSGAEAQGRFQVSLLKGWNLSSQEFRRQRIQHLLSEA